MLPLFGQHDRANTLYVADCCPSGDHDGTISRFNAYEPIAHAWLPADRPDPVRIGDRWVDVFLWKGQVLIGDAQALWAQLAPFKAELQQLAPLSLLDAAMHATAPERDVIAPIAMAYVTRRFGVDRANFWREGTLRRHASVVIRRIVPEFREASVLAGHAVFTDARAVHLKLSRPVLEQLQKVGALQSLIEDMRLLAASLHLDVDLLDSEWAGESKVFPTDVDLSSVGSRVGQNPGAVLILSIGRRAREIGRHIKEPAWLPVDVSNRDLRDDEPITGSGTSKIVQIVNGDDPQARSKLATKYSVVVVLIDDLIAVGDKLTRGHQELLEHVAQLGAVRILVPALPERHPSIMLCGPSVAALRDWSRFHALLDTSQARSPFWWGSPKRSLDRRIADIISGAACMCLSGSISVQVQNGSVSDGLMVFAVDLERGYRPHDDPQLSLGSESTWSELGLPEVHKSFTFFKESAQVIMRNGTGVRRALLEHRSRGGFGGFAAAVINALSGNDEHATVRRGADMRSPPQFSRQVLQFPEMALPVDLPTADVPHALLITAETPTLDAVIAASRSGWRVARYTDRDTLRALLRAKNQLSRRNVPGEVALAPISTSETNRSLATRGADTRDIIRLDFDQLHEWLDRVSPDDRNLIQNEVRPLRVSGDNVPVRDSLLVALRRKRLVKGRLEDDPTFQVLAEVLKVAPRELMSSRPYKRAADLNVCWASPTDEFMRFAIADGEIPPVVMLLRSQEVVLQTFFVIDGDWSVPALFRSRIFGIWAAATLSRSSSWMSRFSLGATFAGFPLPSPFNIVQTSSAGYALKCANNELLALSKDVEGHIDRLANAEGRSNWKSAQRSQQIQELPAAKRLEELILAAYELPPDADDLSILERVVELNRLLGVA